MTGAEKAFGSQKSSIRWSFPLYIPEDIPEDPAVVKQFYPIVAAALLGLGSSQAEIGTNAEPGDFHVKFGIIHGLGELVGTGLAADGEGFMAGLEYQYTDHLGINGRYEVADFDIYQNFRLTLDRKMDLTDDLSLHLAGGYNWQNLLARSVETDGLLANVGLSWERGTWFFGANYYRIFALDTSTNFSTDGVSGDLPEKHSDLVEVVAGYRFSEDFALTLSYERQIGGDTQIEMKKHVILAVRLKL